MVGTSAMRERRTYCGAVQMLGTTTTGSVEGARVLRFVTVSDTDYSIHLHNTFGA